MPIIGTPNSRVVETHSEQACASIPLSIKHIGILMVLFTSFCVVELYFFCMNFREGAADIVS